MERPAYLDTPSGQIAPGLLLAVVAAFCATSLSLVFTIAPAHNIRTASGERQEVSEPSAAVPSTTQSDSTPDSAWRMSFEIREQGWTLAGTIEDTGSDDGLARESWQSTRSLAPGSGILVGLMQDNEVRAWKMASGSYQSGAAPPCQTVKFPQSHPAA